MQLQLVPARIPMSKLSPVRSDMPQTKRLTRHRIAGGLPGKKMYSAYQARWSQSLRLPALIVYKTV